MVKMKMCGIFGLILLLWMALESVNGEKIPDRFLRDLIATFQLAMPTIVYDTDEPPEICYTDQWVLCLSSEHRTHTKPVKELLQNTENCLTVSGADPGKKCIFPFTLSGITNHACTNRDSRGARMYCPTENCQSITISYAQTDNNRPFSDDNVTDFNYADLWDTGKWGYCGVECPVEGKDHIT